MTWVSLELDKAFERIERKKEEAREREKQRETDRKSERETERERECVGERTYPYQQLISMGPIVNCYS